MADSLCHRIGPGRLPYASRRDVGGGIAMAANVLLAAVLWYAGAGLVLATDGFGALSPSSELGFAVAGSVLVAPFGLLGAFVVGTLCWRHLLPDEPAPRLGALGGVLTAAGSLIVGALGAGLVFSGLVLYEEGATAVYDVVLFVPMVVIVAIVFAVLFAGWFVAPLAAFGGWYHERTRSQTSDTAPK